MGSTLAELRASLRGLLLDTTGLPLWSDAVLNLALWEAVAEHSYLFPQRVRLLYSLGAGTAAVPLFAADTAPGVPVAGPATAGGAADVIGVQHVELPVGTPIIADPRQITDPAASGSGHYAQAWLYVGGVLYLRNPASGPEVGTNTLLVELLQTYSLPDVPGTTRWNGPAHDGTLLLWLAERAAYQMAAGWALRDVLPAGRPAANIPAALASLEIEIARAIRLRQGRAARARTLDI